jgi:4,5-DOPA dioxygenase extradiol
MDKLNDQEYAYYWTINMNDKFKELIQAGDHKSLINYSSLGKEAILAIPTPEHYLPLMYTLGLKTNKDNVSFFNDRALGDSLTMTSVKLG